MKALLLAGLAAISFHGRAEAANIWSEPRTGGLGGTYVHIDGEIISGDYSQFERVALNSPRPIYVVPSGPGGSVVEALYTTPAYNSPKGIEVIQEMLKEGFDEDQIARLFDSKLHLCSATIFEFDLATLVDPLRSA